MLTLGKLIVLFLMIIESLPTTSLGYKVISQKEREEFTYVDGRSGCRTGLPACLVECSEAVSVDTRSGLVRTPGSDSCSHHLVHHCLGVKT